MAASDPIAFLAEQLLPQFVPKDIHQTSLDFQFTMVAGKTYRVKFNKKDIKRKPVWVFEGYDIVTEEEL
ncbi:hypothetical protein [Mucilaginibacter paludis]|uniref:Uncharacterized protein n=1 Tax=Mucilaginibacter paludis DSM 18603 TaxID=714943 RepID=H1Y5Z9_9SPHI|nr:hypothetical protein [Mucilaginibacter paludis]EHQ30421.1 hypothetical protein Mucpa_6367 [Mucilaginibacter paludis DSM 18603]